MSSICKLCLKDYKYPSKLKKILPLLRIKSKIVIINITGDSVINKNTETKKSPKGFIKLVYIIY